MMRKKTNLRRAVMPGAVILAGIILASCGKPAPPTAESLMQGLMTQWQSEDTLSMSGRIGLGMALTIFGETESIEASGAFRSDAKDGLEHTLTDLNAKIGGQENTSSIERYTSESGGKKTVYAREDDGEWTCTTEDARDDGDNPVFDLGIEDGGLVMAEEEDAYVVSAQLDFARLRDSLGLDLDRLIGAAPDDLDSQSMADIPKARGEFRFDKKTRSVTGFSIDMKDSFQGVCDLYVRAAAGDTSGMFDPEDLKSIVSIDVTEYRIDIDTVRFGDDLKIEIPDEALTAKPAEEAASVPAP